MPKQKFVYAKAYMPKVSTAKTNEGGGIVGDGD